MMAQPLTPTLDTRSADGSGAAFGPPWSFESLIRPVSVEEFCSEYWGKRSLHVKRGAPGFYRDLVSLEEVERQLSVGQLLRRETVRLRRREYGPFEYPASLSAVYAGLMQGKSLQLRNMERFMDPEAPLVTLVRQMELGIEHPLDSISCYVTPAKGESLVPHHDESEIFTLQVEGTKHWRFHQKVEGERPGTYAPEEVGPVTAELTLEPGDFLYHPRGQVHEVQSEDGLSFSITIVFLPLNWSSMLDALVARLASRPEFVGQMPAGTLWSGKRAEALGGELAARLKLIRDELERFSPQAMLDQLASRNAPRMPAKPEPHLRHALRVEEVELGTALSRRRDLVHHLARSGLHEVTLSVAGSEPVVFPDSAEAALRWVLAGEEPFRPKELPGLTPEDQVLLAKILIREGLVRFC